MVKKITQTLRTKKIMQPLVTKTNYGTFCDIKKHATSWDKKIMQSPRKKKSRNLSGQKKVMQMAPNYSKWFQMTMA